MSKETDNSASAGAASGVGPRIHRARAQGKSKNVKRILVVDDDKIILKTTSAKLKAAGYEVLTAEDGGSAIRQARQLQPHLILLDLNFPPDVGHGGGIPWDGLLILSWIRRTMGDQKIPVIVITGGSLEKYKASFVEAGVLDVFLKPLDHEALLATIRWAIGDEEGAEQKPTPEDPSGQSPAEPSAVVEPEAGRRILFVDDASDWRYLATSYVGERGYEVVTAEDAVSAMLQVSKCKPNLVVLDLNLGGQSAVSLLKALSELHADMPILIHTGMELNDAEVSELLNLGGWGWIPKGSMENLVKAIEASISAPKPEVAPRAAEPAETETVKDSEAPCESISLVMAKRTEAAPECEVALPSLEGLRTGTTEELFSAVERARSVTPEPPQVVPEARGVVPAEMMESAAGAVLIVEDDAAFSDTLRTFLESQSFRVTEVKTGAEAMCLVALVDVELILFDLTLPDFHVQEFYEAVQKVKPHLCPRIIFMTSDDSNAQDDGFVRRLKGVSLWKPFPMEWLTEAVETIRGGARQVPRSPNASAKFG